MASQIQFSSQGKSIDAELYLPAGAGPYGVVIIAYGTDGMTDNLTGPWATTIRDYAESIASAGSAALIPNYFESSSTRPGTSALEAIAIYRDRWQRVILDSIAHATTLANVDSSRVGLLGFSLGGHLCLRLREKVKVVVEFFAPLMDGIGNSTATNFVQIHHGSDDRLVDFSSNAKPIKAILDSEGTRSELIEYSGANHGFVGADSSNENARSESKVAAINYISTHL